MFRPGRVVLVVAVLLAGCGSEQTDMSASTASTLQQDVRAVVEAAEASQWDTAATALHELTRDVARAQAAGELSAERAERILAAAQRVTEDLDHMPTPEPEQQPAPDEDEGADDGAPGRSGEAEKDEESKKGKDGGKRKDKEKDEKGED